jgi:hypothetical protein
LPEPAPRRDPERVLVLTLASGEPQLPACRAAVANQAGPVAHRVIAGLDNRTAHRTLYDAVAAGADEHDLILKVDADMVLGAGAVEAIRAWFRARPDADHAVFAVDDFYTGRPIFGLHAFSHRCRWPQSLDPLFVDPAPVVPGTSTVVAGAPSPVAAHAPDPSVEQAWSFGVHRALKAVQPNGGRFQAGQAAAQWAILEDTWREYRRTGDRRLAVVLLGAADVMARAGSLDPDVLYLSAEARRRMPDAAMSDNALDLQVRRHWAATPGRAWRRARALGSANRARVAAVRVRDLVHRGRSA